ncbi:PAS domain-containing protein [Leptolyngbya sp. 'hensonii']|nr:PAS domain-containing protein [Leptolyngbya sp. 'hensonii']
MSQTLLHFESQLLAQMREAVIALDLAHRVTYWNKAAEHL